MSFSNPPVFVPVSLNGFWINFRVNGHALQQIKEKDYAGKYRTQGIAVHLIDVTFSSKKRNIIDFKVES